MTVTTQFFLKKAVNFLLEDELAKAVGGTVCVVSVAIGATDGAAVGAVGVTGGVMIRATIDFNVDKNPPWKMSVWVVANNGVNTP
jgi:hypothetical protein